MFLFSRIIIKKSLLFSMLLFLFGGPAGGEISALPLGHGYEFVGNGKIAGREFKRMYEKLVPEYSRIENTQDFFVALKNNARVLARLRADQVFKFDNLTFSGEQLKKVGEILSAAAVGQKTFLPAGLEFFQIKGEDGRGNVHFTGYFTPRLAAREKADAVFRFPIYRMPKIRPIPARRAIDHENALSGQGLEMAFTDSLLDNFFLSVQGSGVLDFGGGKTRQIGFAGANGHPYRSVGKMLVSNGSISPEKISLRSIRAWFDKHPQQLVPMLNQNPSYTFFAPRPDQITGAAGVGLTALHSIAVDKACIPYGACLLAEIPVLNDNGELVGHQWRILFAQDTGGAIRGPGHVDLYFGQGRQAGDRAGDLHHYGRIWLILPQNLE